MKHLSGFVIFCSALWLLTFWVKTLKPQSVGVTFVFHAMLRIFFFSKFSLLFSLNALGLNFQSAGNIVYALHHFVFHPLNLTRHCQSGALTRLLLRGSLKMGELRHGEGETFDALIHMLSLSLYLSLSLHFQDALWSNLSSTLESDGVIRCGVGDYISNMVSINFKSDPKNVNFIHTLSCCPVFVALIKSFDKILFMQTNDLSDLHWLEESLWHKKTGFTEYALHSFSWRLSCKYTQSCSFLSCKHKQKHASEHPCVLSQFTWDST